LIIGWISGCGGSAPSSDFSAISPPSGGGLQGGEVRPIDFTQGTHGEISFTDLSGGEKFSVFLISSNLEKSSFNIEINSLNNSFGTKGLEIFPEEEAEPAEELTETDPTALLHQRLREEESHLSPTEYPLSNTKRIQTPLAPCAEGRGFWFYVLGSLSDTSKYESVCGVELTRTNHVIYYVDTAVESNLPLHKLSSIIEDFDKKIPFERELLGNESDVNQDGTISVLFTPAVNRLGNSGGGYVTGYFYGSDLFPSGGSIYSNQQEILLISSPDPNGQWGYPIDEGFWLSNIAATVLPHEFQHMISFNQHVLINQDGGEEMWANEGISHLMEDIQTNGSMGQTGPENPSRVGLYLKSPTEAPLTQGTSVAQRGGTYLLFRYLYEQANLGRFSQVLNGADFLASLEQEGFKGVSNLEHATGWDFQSILLDFFATLRLSDTGITSNPRYNFSGICLTCSQNDNRGTTLRGVTTLGAQVPMSMSVNAPSGVFVDIDGNTLITAGQGLSFSASPGMIINGAVIRIE
jgi:hypothetical protein